MVNPGALYCSEVNPRRRIVSSPRVHWLKAKPSSNTPGSTASTLSMSSAVSPLAMSVAVLTWGARCRLMVPTT